MDRLIMHLYQLRKGRDWIILLIMIRYGLAEDIDLRVKEIIGKLKMNHIDGTRVICLRSKGSGGKRVFRGGFRAHKP
jgi:hypothetical protein